MQNRFDVVIDPYGNAIPGVSITVNISGGGLATIYSDNGVTPTANPLTSNALGEYSFYAANGTYSLVFTAPNFPGLTVPGVVLFDPLDSNVPFGLTQTLNVPSQYATISAALTAISGWSIYGKLNIQVADGTYTLSQSITANHPFGQNIQILGNVTTPANCIITVSGVPTFDALVVSNAHALGLLDGFTFTLASKATSANNYTAILALNGGSIKTGTHVVANNWYYGIAARNGSNIYCRGAQVTNAGDVGIWAYISSTIDAQGASSTGASDVANSLGFGFQAERESSIDCTNATASGCNIGGIASLSNSHTFATGSTSNSNTGSGYFVRDGSTIEAATATANNNTRYAQEWLADGRFYVGTLTASGNSLGANNGQVYLDNGSLGARIAANGDLRVDVNGANNWFFNSSGGTQLQIASTASSVAWVSVTGGTASPFIKSGGAASNIDMNVQGKGTGSVFLGNNAANYLRVNPQASGTAPQLRAEGVDTDIDLLIGGKGAGLVRFGTVTASGDAAMSGYITVKDAAGTSRKLMVTP